MKRFSINNIIVRKFVIEAVTYSQLLARSS